MNKTNNQRTTAQLISPAVCAAIGLGIGTTGGLITTMVLREVSFWMFMLPVLGLIAGFIVGRIVSNALKKDS